MWGNHMADVVASHGTPARLRGTPPGLNTSQLIATTIPIREVVSSAMADQIICWTIGLHDTLTVCQHSTHSSNTQLQQYLTERESYSADINRQSNWVGTSAAFAARCWSLRTRSLRSRAFAIRIIWDKGMHGGNRSKGHAYTPEQKTFLSICTACGHPDSADHWIRHCPHGLMQQHRKECLSAIQTYVDTVKLTAVADVLHHMVSLALNDEDGHRIWTANWTERCQQELSPYIDKASKVIPLAGLRTHMVAISRHFITAITRMWVDKMSLPLHPSIADRLATDMATLANHYHQTHAWKRSARRPTTPTTRIGLPPAIRHRHTAFTPQQRRNQRNNSRAKERRALAQLSLATVATTPLITQFFQSVKTKAADAASSQRTPRHSFPRVGEG